MGEEFRFMFIYLIVMFILVEGVVNFKELF